MNEWSHWEFEINTKIVKLFTCLFQRMHSHIKVDAIPVPAAQPSAAAFMPVAQKSKWKHTDPRQIQLTNSVVGLIANDLLPLSLVDSEKFRSLLATAEPSFTMPSRKHLSTQLLPQRAATVRDKLITLLSRAQDVALTIDLWSSRDMRAFIGVTAHFILDFTMRGAMLACHRVRGSHTAENIHILYEETVACYKLGGKISKIVTDNGSNMVKAFTLPGLENLNEEEDDYDNDETVELSDDREILEYLPPQRVPCFAHTLQLVVKDGLQHAGQMRTTIAKVAKLVSYVRKSTTASEVLEGHLKLQMANQTRWNSQLKMLRSVARIPEDVLRKLDYTPKLTAYELKLIAELCEILLPFEEVTDRIQGQCIVTSSSVIACVRGLRHLLVQLRETYNSKIITTLQSSLEKRLAQFEHMTCFQLAAVLDPRFKLDWCLDAEVPDMRTLLRSTAKKTATRPPATESADEPPPAKRSKLFNFMANRSTQHAHTDTDTITPENNEVTTYLEQPCEPEDSDPLCYWQKHATQFPRLSQLACNYLAMPASSAPVERLFSVAGKVFKPERCCLSDARFEQLMMIRCNDDQ